MKDINALLESFQHFGIHLGLERIHHLLKKLGDPHHHVPIIHVAGTNGKGSVCAYLSSVLTEAGYRVGRYTSPHLVNWTERICLNEKPITSEELGQILQQIQATVNSEQESPTQFEVITAAAWLYFAQEKVDVAVMEVGLGGRLDATNVCDRPLVSIITSLSRDHWQRLGSTLAQIAREKAGILKPNCPAVIGKLPPEAKAVVEKRIQDLHCPAVWVEPAQEIPKPNSSFTTNLWASYNSQQLSQAIQYPLPLLGKFQLINSAIAVATLQLLQQQGWKISESAIQTGMAKTQWLGRLHWSTWKNHRLLIDGAHNVAGAKELREYLDCELANTSITWVIGILSTKDYSTILKTLLCPGDRAYFVPVPDHSTTAPEELAEIARSISPQITCQTAPELFIALEEAVQSSNPVVFCGSLYLVGHFLKIAHYQTL